MPLTDKLSATTAVGEGIPMLTTSCPECWIALMTGGEDSLIHPPDNESGGTRGLLGGK